MNANTASNVVLNISNVVTLTGGGTISMAKTASGNPIFLNSNNGQLVNVNNLIQGAGEIGNNGLIAVNEAGGTINANSAGQTLTIDVTGPFNNSGLVETTGTGVMQINTSINNSGVIFPGGPKPERH